MPTPYFVDRFNAVADRGNCHFEAWFNVEREHDRSWTVEPSTWRFHARWIPCQRSFGFAHHLPLAELRETRPDVFIQEYHRVHLALAVFPATATASRVALRLLPNFDAVSDRTWWREIGKHWIFRAVDGAKVPGPDGLALGRRYGLTECRMTTVTQSIDVAHYAQAAEVPQVVRQRERVRLGLKGCVFLYVGRLVRVKGVDYMLEAFRMAQKVESGISLLLVGDGVDEQRYREWVDVNGLNARFAGFIHLADLPMHYALADVLIFPTLGDAHGLVVEEALSAGLPVVASSSAGDIGLRLDEGRTGFIVRPGEPADLAERIVRLARDPKLLRGMSETVRQSMMARGHDSYALEFEEFVERMLECPQRRSVARTAARLLGLGLLATAIDRSPAGYVSAESGGDGTSP